MLNKHPERCEKYHLFILFDLGKVFSTLGTYQKHFKVFHLNNTAITELNGILTWNITFDSIRIESCTQLKTINDTKYKEFMVSQDVTEKIEIENNPVLTSPDGTLFKILKKFIKIQFISLLNNNITEIPDSAFTKPDFRMNLKQLVLGGVAINKLGNSAFLQLAYLEFLYIVNTSIDYIPENGLDFFYNPEYKPVTIIFDQNRICPKDCRIFDIQIRTLDYEPNINYKEISEYSGKLDLDLFIQKYQIVKRLVSESTQPMFVYNEESLLCLSLNTCVIAEDLSSCGSAPVLRISSFCWLSLGFGLRFQPRFIYI